MNTTKRQRLETAGWEVTSVEAFLGLTPEDVAAIEERLAADAQEDANLEPASKIEKSSLPKSRSKRELVAP